MCKHNYINNQFITNDDSALKFIELSQKFVVSQIDVDPEIQNALNKFAEIYGEDKPTKDRF